MTILNLYTENLNIYQQKIDKSNMQLNRFSTSKILALLI